ncbi:MAG: RNB domain-containing ribonuclease [Synechococcus sp. SP2 MAG]|nr:RNB domain-containing ribonuclease [Synechococcus sp. SP2 MAG]
MKFTVADLLDQVPQDGSLEVSKLEKILRLTNRADKQSLSIALKGLDRLGVLNLEEESSVSRSDDIGLIEARLRCSSKGFCFAIRDDGDEDIYIRDHQLNHAWNGDRVLVRIIRDAGRRRSPEGGVQCILQRATTSLLAQVEQQDERLLAVPLDDRLLASIELPEGDSDYQLEGPVTSVVEVQLDRYPIAQHPARGHVARSLPLNGGVDADRDLLLTKAHLHSRASAPRTTIKAPADKRRKDLTDQPCLLLNNWEIDGAPLLPAVHVIPHDGGTQLWIHAPAVAERVNPGNSLDQWLCEQSEALCLGNKWIPLLSANISKAAAFKVGDSQSAVSLRIDLDAEGEARGWEFCLTQIRPVAEVTSEALAALAGRKPRSRAIPAALKSIKDQIGQLETLIFCAKALHAADLRQGKIELDLPTPNLETLGDLRATEPDGGNRQWIEPLRDEDPFSILAVFLRAAHATWTEHCLDFNLPALVLQANDPDSGPLNDVAKAAIALELPLSLDEEGTTSASELAQALIASPSRRVLNLQLRHTLPDPQYRLIQAKAKHIALAGEDDGSATETEDCLEAIDTANDSDEMSSPAQDGSTPLLAPWCCPGLHYADLLNQQVLCQLLNDGKDRPSVRQKETVNLGSKGAASSLSWPLFSGSLQQRLQELLQERQLQRLNSRRRQQTELRRDVIAMAQARSAEPMLDHEQQGVISGVQSYGFFVEIAPSMVEGLVHVSSLNDDWYEYRSRQNRLVGRRNRRVYKLGDPVTVRVTKVDVLRNQIDLDIVMTPEQAQQDESPMPVAVSEG